MRFLLVILAGLSFGVSASPVPNFVSSIEVDSALFDKGVRNEQTVDNLQLGGARNQFVAHIPTDCGSTLTSDISTVVQPDVMSGGLSAFVKVSIATRVPENPTACEQKALSLVPPVNIDVPIDMGTSTLNIKNPNWSGGVQFDVVVSYQPDIPPEFLN